MKGTKLKGFERARDVGALGRRESLGVVEGLRIADRVRRARLYRRGRGDVQERDDFHLSAALIRGSAKRMAGLPSTDPTAPQSSARLRPSAKAQTVAGS